MTTAEFVSTITFLVETFLSARSKANAANKAKCTFEDAPSPGLKGQYENIDDWSCDAALIELYNQKKNELEATQRTTDAAYKEAERKLIDVLPRRVWIRFGDVGIGVGDTNWGGNKRYICVEEWQTDMPTLDHTYRGD